MEISLPRDTHNYLIQLAALGKKGVTENEVAVNILIGEVERMQRENFEEVLAQEPGH